jgi:hypothetical protein
VHRLVFRNAFPNISIQHTTAFGRASRSSSVRHEVFRSTAALAMLFQTYPYTTRLPSGELRGRLPSDTRSSGRRPLSPNMFRTFVRVTGRHDLSNSSVCGTTRQRSGEHSGRRPSDARSSGRPPHSPSFSEHFHIRHDHLPASTAAAGRPTRGRPSGRLPCTPCFSEHFRIRHAGSPATNVHLRWRDGEDRAVSRRPPGGCPSRSAKLEDFSAGTLRGPHPPYSIESIPFLGRFLARSKSGRTKAPSSSLFRPRSLYIVGCGIPVAARPDTSAGDVRRVAKSPAVVGRRPEPPAIVGRPAIEIVPEIAHGGFAVYWTALENGALDSHEIWHEHVPR